MNRYYIVIGIFLFLAVSSGLYGSMGLSFVFSEKPEIPIPELTGDPNECWVDDGNGEKIPCSMDDDSQHWANLLLVVTTLFLLIIPAILIISSVIIYKKKIKKDAKH